MADEKTDYCPDWATEGAKVAVGGLLRDRSSLLIGTVVRLTPAQIVVSVDHGDGQHPEVIRFRRNHRRLYAVGHKPNYLGEYQGPTLKPAGDLFIDIGDHLASAAQRAIYAYRSLEYARRQTSASVIDLAARLRSLAQRAENGAAHILEELG